MGKNVSKSGKKTGKKARKKAAQKRKLIRTGLIYFALLVICIGCLVLLPQINRPEDKQNTWAMQNEKKNAGTGDVIEDALARRAQETGSADIDAITLDDVEAPVTAEPTEAPTPEPTPEPTEAPTPEPTEVPSDVTITITAAGDCTFGGCLKHDTFKVFKKYVDKYGYDYFFDKVRTIFQNDDLTIVNLEGPLTDIGTMTHKSSICFRGEPEWTAIMTGSSVELCNVANNHILDMGEAGAKRTLQALDEAGLGYCGYTKVYHTTIKGVRITALGFDKWHHNEKQAAEAIKRERPNCDLLIVNFHWGWEMKFAADDQQKRLGHACVNAGADLVIGTHTHVFGGVEQDKGKYICWSLGNFCFGGNTVPPDQRAMMFQQTFVVSPDKTVSDGGINILPCRVSSDDHKNNFQPYVLGKEAGTKLLRKIARYSNLPKSIKWMPGSYLEQIGLIAPSSVQMPPAAQSAAPVQADEGVFGAQDADPEDDPGDESLEGTEFAEDAGEDDWEEMDGADLSMDEPDPEDGMPMV